MKLWIDDVRPAPEKWYHAFTTNEALDMIEGEFYYFPDQVLEVSLDHDAGNCVSYGGDYIQILNKLEALSNYDNQWHDYLTNKVTFHIHSMNVVGVENMRRIIRKNGWKEI